MKRLLLILLCLPLTAGALLPNPAPPCWVSPGTTNATIYWNAVPGASYYSLWALNGCGGGTYGTFSCVFAQTPVPSFYMTHMKSQFGLRALKPSQRVIVYITTNNNGIVGSLRCEFRTLALPRV